MGPTIPGTCLLCLGRHYPYTALPTVAMMGGQVMIKIVHAIWTYVLDTWMLQNTHLHHHAAQLDLPNYKQAAKTFYELHHQLSPTVQTALY